VSIGVFASRVKAMISPGFVGSLACAEPLEVSGSQRARRQCPGVRIGTVRIHFGGLRGGPRQDAVEILLGQSAGGNSRTDRLGHGAAREQHCTREYEQGKQRGRPQAGAAQRPFR
jgi:hypothetical protein